MRISEISPVLYGISFFKYSDKNKYKGILSEKSQYVYRFLCITKGSFSIFIGDKKEECSAGDIIYLTPGESYRLYPDQGEFSLYNVFFDFFSQSIGKERKEDSCVFKTEFSAKLCSEKICFKETDRLNTSGVFRNAEFYEIIKRLVLYKKSDLMYGFYTESALFSLISSVLQTRSVIKGNRDSAEKIIEYINLNPNKDLSAKRLSEKFSYHRNYINYLVKNATGMTSSEYVCHVKIRYAKVLLLEGEIPLTEVSNELGYYDYSHFYKAFVKETGISPAEYVKMQKKRFLSLVKPF